jgi:hypothetical protein
LLNLIVARKSESIKEICVAAEVVQGWQKEEGGQKEEYFKEERIRGDDVKV